MHLIRAAWSLGGCCVSSEPRKLLIFLLFLRKNLNLGPRALQNNGSEFLKGNLPV